MPLPLQERRLLRADAPLEYDFAVDHYGRHRADAVTLRLIATLRSFATPFDHLATARQDGLSNQLQGVVTERATGREHFDSSLSLHIFCYFLGSQQQDFNVLPVFLQSRSPFFCFSQQQVFDSLPVSLQTIVRESAADATVPMMTAAMKGNHFVICFMGSAYALESCPRSNSFFNLAALTANRGAPFLDEERN